RQAAALRFRQLTGGGFNSDEWREAPRLINRLDAGSVVLYCGQGDVGFTGKDLCTEQGIDRMAGRHSAGAHRTGHAGGGTNAHP
ncbi:hypothetical protein K7A10_03455, partial [Escherichia coli]|nr:hypothetical protein [Escherichia coli]